jgi:dTDP-4-dehydrorhamnose reductase
LLYISTAGIFDGEKDLYDDWDMPNPLGVYARSKYMGERFVV